MTLSDVRFDRNLAGILFAFLRTTIAAESRYDRVEIVVVSNRHERVAIGSGPTWTRIRVPSVRTSNTSIAHVITKLLIRMFLYSERSFIYHTRPRRAACLSLFPVVLRGQRQRLSDASYRPGYVSRRYCYHRCLRRLIGGTRPCTFPRPPPPKRPGPRWRYDGPLLRGRDRRLVHSSRTL